MRIFILSVCVWLLAGSCQAQGVITKVVPNCQTHSNSFDTQGYLICLTCKTGYYKSSISNSCPPCSSTCLTCSGSSMTCTSCPSGSYLSGSSSCLSCGLGCASCSSAVCTTCREGYFKNPTGSCSACISNCAVCTSSVGCSTCMSGSDLKVENGVTICKLSTASIVVLIIVVLIILAAIGGCIFCCVMGICKASSSPSHVVYDNQSSFHGQVPSS